MSFQSEGINLLADAVSLHESGESFALATVVWRRGPSSGHQGSRAIIKGNGAINGWVGGACAEPIVIREAKKVISSGKATILWLGQPEELAELKLPDGVLTVPMACQSEGALQVYIEPVVSAPHIVVVGRSPMTKSLAGILENIEWKVSLVDASEFTTELASKSHGVIVATQGHGDEDALYIALTGKPSFIGVVASAKRGLAIKEFMLSRGFSASEVEQIIIPVGLDLGPTSHVEMAVSIAAQLVELRSQEKLKASLTNEGLTTLPLIENQNGKEVLDLICGMTVEAVSSNFPYEFEGTTYYFCAAGCRTKFEKDPKSYIKQETK